MITSVLASVAVALALPGGGGGGGGDGIVCHSSTFPNPECCATDILGVADLDCTPRKLSPELWIERDRLFLLTASPIPHSISAFTSTCAAIGKTARCCLLPVVRKSYLILVDAVLKFDGT